MDLQTIASLITRLLSHYWASDDHAASRQAQIEDWIEDLVEFGPEIVAEACRQWRQRPGGKRPTPGDIRALCVAEQRQWQERARALPPPAVDELEARRMADEWAIRRGFMNIEHFQRENSVGASIKLGNGQWLRFPSLRPLGPGAIGPVSGFNHPAAALGVKAREYTQEELRAGRIALGLEAADAEENAA